ncbi:MAG: hypothetical protein R3Y54_09000 [Eubacteriales bacterium]
MGIIEWAADTVQTATGEKERRLLVQKIKDFTLDFKSNVKSYIVKINEIINSFNCYIAKINEVRNTTVKDNICSLSIFLNKFGELQSYNEFALETEKNSLILPEKAFEKEEQYINEIDWSQGDVFTNTLFLTPIGMAMKTKKQNLSMQEQLSYLKIEADSTLRQLEGIELSVGQDLKIAQMYISCIELIGEYVNKSILPELELVEAFLQVNIIKNELIVGNELQNIEFINNLHILNNGRYQKHYNFIKNTFAFYIISCKIFNTPVLTKLIEGNTELTDFKLLEDNKQLLLNQKQQIQLNMVFLRGE